MFWTQNGDVVSRAKIRREGGFLDEATRQHKVFLEVQNGDTSELFAGDFVRVVLPGRTIAATLDIPASALTREGHVWFLDGDDRLQRVKPQVLFRKGDRVVVQPPSIQKDWRIAVTPLVSFLPGQMVKVKAVWE